ncbi:MAG: hypothetical protein ACI9G1_003089, partial [Pirellulaceae bacterium]
MAKLAHWLSVRHAKKNKEEKQRGRAWAREHNYPTVNKGPHANKRVGPSYPQLRNKSDPKTGGRKRPILHSPLPTLFFLLLFVHLMLDQPDVAILQQVAVPLQREAAAAEFRWQFVVNQNAVVTHCERGGRRVVGAGYEFHVKCLP